MGNKFDATAWGKNTKPAVTEQQQIEQEPGDPGYDLEMAEYYMSDDDHGASYAEFEAELEQEQQPEQHAEQHADQPEKTTTKPASIPRPYVEQILNLDTINEINAGPGVGKTTLLSMLAACTVTGRAFLGRFRVRRGVVVFFTEDPESVVNCLSAWQLEWGVNILDRVMIENTPARLTDFVRTETGRYRPSEAYKAQIQRIKDFAGDLQVCMVVYDSKTFHMNSAKTKDGKSLEENSNDHQHYLTNAGLFFAKQLGACGIFIPHVSKEAEKSDALILESRGGGAAKGAVWKTFSLTPDKTDPMKVILAPGKRRGGGISSMLRLTRRSMRIFDEDEAQRQKANYDAAFEGSEIPPADALEGISVIDPLMTGGFLNESEPVDADTLAAELAAKLDDKKGNGGSKRGGQPEAFKGDQKLQRVEGKTAQAYEHLIQFGGQMDAEEYITQIVERGFASNAQNARRLIRTLTDRGYLTQHDDPSGRMIYTANNASPQPFKR